MELSTRDRALLEGDLGDAARMSMSILVRMAEVVGAEKMLDITGAHIDATIYVGDAGLEFAERLASSGGQVAVPSTLNVSGLDEHHWKEWPVEADWAEKAHRQMAAYQKMGTIPIWTCAPYQTEHAPKRGEQIAWGESNAIAFANSVLGARTERYPDYLDIAAAIAGRVPAVGLHLEENRRGQLVLDLGAVPRIDRRTRRFLSRTGKSRREARGRAYSGAREPRGTPDPGPAQSAGRRGVVFGQRCIVSYRRGHARSAIPRRSAPRPTAR